MTSPLIPLYQPNDLLLSFCKVWWQSTNSLVPDGRFTSSGSSFLSYDVTSGFVSSPPIPLCQPNDLLLICCQVWWQSTNFPVPDGRFTFSGSSFWSSDVTSGLVTSPSIPLYQRNDLLLSFCQVWWQSINSPVPDGRFTSSGSSFWSYDLTSGFVISSPIPLCHPPNASLALCKI